MVRFLEENQRLYRQLGEYHWMAFKLLPKLQSMFWKLFFYLIDILSLSGCLRYSKEGLIGQLRIIRFSRLNVSSTSLEIVASPLLTNEIRLHQFIYAKSNPLTPFNRKKNCFRFCSNTAVNYRTNNAKTYL